MIASFFVSAFLLQATYIDLFNDGHRLLEAGKLKEAETALKSSASLNPKYAPTLKDLGEYYARTKRLPEAIDQYKKAVDLAPNDINARGRLAELYSWIGYHDKSIVTYRDALELDPKNLNLKTGLATVLRWSHRYDEAISLNKEVLREDPDNHEALKGLEKSYSMAGDLAHADEVLDRAIKKYPQDAELFKDRGTVLGWQREFKQSIALLQKAVELSPGYTEAFRTMGDVYTWMKADTQAAESYGKAVEIEPGSLENYILLAGALKNAGKTGPAEEALRAALKIDPADPRALQLLRTLREDGGYTVIKGVGEVLEICAFVLVFVIIFVVSRNKKRILKRKHRAYFLFVKFVLPAIVLVTFAAYIGKGSFQRWVNVALIEEFTEAVLFMSLACSFFAILWSEKRGKDFAKTVILAVGAHPDDIELGCGGFLMKARDSGAEVYGITMTKGEKGTDKNGRREDELEKAAGFMELNGYWVMDFPDTGLRDLVKPMKDIIEEKVKETGANMVLTHSPMDLHSDHQAVFEASKVAARNISMLCYEDVSTPREFVPNYFIDITGYIGDKVRLVAFHRTQNGKSYMDPEAVKGRAAHRGIQCGIQYAEAYRIHKLLR